MTVINYPTDETRVTREEKYRALCVGGPWDGLKIDPEDKPDSKILYVPRTIVVDETGEEATVMVYNGDLGTDDKQCPVLHRLIDRYEKTQHIRR
jgi:hypothetical protein